MSTLLSPEEKARRIAAGEAVRKARAEKRKQLQINKEKEKEEILKQSLVAMDAYHKGLNKQIAKASHYLHDVIYRGETLVLKKIPEIADLFNFPSELDARVAFKMCYENYCQLIGRCWHFQQGRVALLAETAITFWDKILSFPEVIADGPLVFYILETGMIGMPILMIFKKHHQKFVENSTAPIIVNICRRHLRNGGMTHILTGEVKVWNEQQQDILRQIISLFSTDLCMSEEFARNTAK